MFEMLRDVDDVNKLTSYLHWSQLCYQYAELVDRESLSWCIEVIVNAKNALFGNFISKNFRQHFNFITNHSERREKERFIDGRIRFIFSFLSLFL